MKKALILLAVFAVAGIANANMLSNGDFSLGSDGSTNPDTQALDWTHYWNAGWINRETNANGPYGDTENFHYAIGNGGPINNGIYQDNPGAAGVTYELTVDVGQDDWWKPDGFIKLEFIDAQGEEIDEAETWIRAEDYDGGVNQPWSNRILIAEAPAGTVIVRAVLGSWTPDDTNQGGTTRFDNAVLVEAGAPKASDPIPGNGDVVGANLATLSWTNPDPNIPGDIITSDVYLLDAGTSPLTGDPNLGPDMFDPGVVQLADDIIEEEVSVSGLIEDHHYYWSVHCTDPHGDPNEPVSQGNVWYFYVGDTMPVVDAGEDQFNWVARDDGDADPTTYTITVTGTYTDDGKSPIMGAAFVNNNWGWDPANGEYGIEEISQEWDQTPNTVHTSGTVTAVFRTVYNEGGDSTAIPGYWDLELQVTDATGTAQDIAYVRVDADCGTAAENDAADPYDGYYDTNKDCIINLVDFAALAEVWLDCNANKLATCQ